MNELKRHDNEIPCAFFVILSLLLWWKKMVLLGNVGAFLTYLHPLVFELYACFALSSYFSRIKYSNTYFCPQVVGWICERCWTRLLIRQKSWFLYKFQLSRRARSFNLKFRNITYLRLHFKRMTDSELGFVIWKMHTNHLISSQNFLMVKRKSLKYLEHPKKHFKKSLFTMKHLEVMHAHEISKSFFLIQIHTFLNQI